MVCFRGEAPDPFICETVTQESGASNPAQWSPVHVTLT